MPVASSSRFNVYRSLCRQRGILFDAAETCYWVRILSADVTHAGQRRRGRYELWSMRMGG
jgi:hypothetical protein